MPPVGSPPLQSGGQNHKRPTSGQGGYIIPAALGCPNRFTEGGRIRSGPQVGKLATKPLAPRGSPLLQTGGAESERAYKWARWVHNPCRLGGPHRFTARGRIRSGPEVGKVARKPLVPGGCPPLQTGGQNQKWPTSGQGGYITAAAWGIPIASERGPESEVTHKRARWLHNHCRLGGPHHFTAGGRM